MKSYPKCHLCRSRFSSEAALSLHIERLPSASALAYGSLPCEGTRTDGRICRRRTRVQYEWPDTTAAPIGVRAHKAALARARYQRKKNLAHPDFQVEWGNQ